MMNRIDSAARIAGGLLAVVMGAGSVALAGGMLVDGRTDGLAWRGARTKAAHVASATPTRAAAPGAVREIRVFKADASHPG